MDSYGVEILWLGLVILRVFRHYRSLSGNHISWVRCHLKVFIFMKASDPFILYNLKKGFKTLELIAACKNRLLYVSKYACRSWTSNLHLTYLPGTKACLSLRQKVIKKKEKKNVLREGELSTHFFLSCSQT